MHRSKSSLRVILALLVVAAGAAACSNKTAVNNQNNTGTNYSIPTGPYTDATKVACSASATSTCVSVANVATIGGPVPGLFQGAEVGADAYLSYVDTSLHGVNGRKIRLISSDDAFNSTNNRTETEAQIGKVLGFVGNFSLFDSAGGQVLAQNPSVPNVSVVLDQTTNDLPNTFSIDPLEGGWDLGGLTYFKQHYPEAVKHTAVIIAGVASAEAQATGLLNAMQHLGYNVVYKATVNPLESNFQPDILRMRSAGVQMVDLTAIDAQVGETLVKQMRQQNFKPQLIESGGPIYVNNFATLAGGNAAADGIYLAQNDALYLGQDANTIPAVKLFLGWVQKVHKGFTPDLYTLYGWASAQLFVQALKAAGSNPTGASVLAQLQQVHSFNASGLTAGSDPAGKKAPTCIIIAKIENGVFTRVSPPSPTNGSFICGGGYYKK